MTVLMRQVLYHYDIDGPHRIFDLLLATNQVDVHLRDNHFHWTALMWACNWPIKYPSPRKGRDPTIQQQDRWVNSLLNYGDWTASQLQETIMMVMITPGPEVYQKGHIAPRVGHLLWRIMRDHGGLDGDGLAEVLIQASNMSCRGCVLAVLAVLGKGPGISFTEECKCASCLIEDRCRWNWGTMRWEVVSRDEPDTPDEERYYSYD